MAFFRLFGFFLDDNKLDEKIGMTEKQKKLAQNSWANVRKDEVSSGVAIMLAFFRQHPEYQKEFKHFKDIPFDELPKHKKFQSHCANIISMLSSVIDHIHDPELMEADLLGLTDRHKTRGQTQEQFKNLRHVLDNLFPSVFGKQYTPEVQEAWKRLLDYIFSIIARTYNDQNA